MTQDLARKVAEVMNAVGWGVTMIDRYYHDIARGKTHAAIVCDKDCVVAVGYYVALVGSDADDIPIAFDRFDWGYVVY